MLRKFGYAATLSVMALATPLFADGGSEALETQVVAITGEGYFPHTTYTASGAIVRFVNETPEARTIVSSDGSWTTGEMLANEEVEITMLSGMVLSFSNGAEEAFVGEISFDPAPDEEASDDY